MTGLIAKLQAIAAALTAILALSGDVTAALTALNSFLDETA